MKLERLLKPDCVAIGYLYAKYFLEADTSNGFGCVYYPDSKTLGVERSLFTLDRE